MVKLSAYINAQGKQVARPKTKTAATVSVITSVRFPANVRATLDKIAKADGRTTSGLVQWIVAEWLKAQGGKSGRSP
jgi:hypothetical protein